MTGKKKSWQESWAVVPPGIRPEAHKGFHEHAKVQRPPMTPLAFYKEATWGWTRPVSAFNCIDGQEVRLMGKKAKKREIVITKETGIKVVEESFLGSDVAAVEPSGITRTAKDRDTLNALTMKERLTVMGGLAGAWARLEEIESELELAELEPTDSTPELKLLIERAHTDNKNLIALRTTYVEPLKRITTAWELLFRPYVQRADGLKARAKAVLSQALNQIEAEKQEALNKLAAGEAEYEEVIEAVAAAPAVAGVRKWVWGYADGKGIKDLPEEFLMVDERKMKAVLREHGADAPKHVGHGDVIVVRNEVSVRA